MKWLTHPEMVLFYGVVGGAIGSLVGPYWLGIQISLVQTILDARYSGFPSILINFVAILGTVLGAVTGCAVAHTFGKYRSIAAGGLILFGLSAAIFMLCMGFPFARSEGRKMALALYGVGFVWSIILLLWGSYLLAKPRRHG